MKYLITISFIAILGIFIYSLMNIRKEMPIEPTYTTEKSRPFEDAAPLKEWECEEGQKCA